MARSADRRRQLDARADRARRRHLAVRHGRRTLAAPRVGPARSGGAGRRARRPLRLRPRAGARRARARAAPAALPHRRPRRPPVLQPTRTPDRRVTRDPARRAAPRAHPKRRSTRIMIKLHTWTTPNGQKIAIALEELGIPYEVHPVNLGKNEQMAPEFLKLNPNHKIPVIEDGGQVIWESGAILLHLGENYDPKGVILPKDPRKRMEAIQHA